MRHLCALFVLMLAVCLPAASVDIYSRFNGSCQQGGSPVTTNGINSSQNVQISFPACTITVFNHGTITLSSIFSDAAGTFPLANPFTATSTGAFGFYAATGRYDAILSGAGILSSFTISDIVLCFNCAGGGGGGNISPGTANSQTTTWFPTSSSWIPQNKPIYDSRDWMTCDGTTDTSAGLHTLLNTIGTQEATIRFIGTTTPSASCRIGNTLFPANITLDFSGGGSITLISSTTAPGGAAFVNGTGVECGTGTTCSLPALSVTAGNTLVVMDAPYPGFTFKILTVTDNCGDFFIHVQQSLVGQPRNQGMWVASGATGGSCTITATANGSLTNNTMIVHQYSGMGPVVSPDGKGSSSNSVVNPMTSGAAATTTGSLLVGFGGQPFQAETCTAGAGFTQPAGLAGQTTNGFMCAQYQLSSAGGNVTATQNITVLPANQVYSLVPLKVGNATASIFGGVVDPDMHQIFFNGDGATGHGVVDFTNNTGITTVYPEWWGASNTATASANTLALQAAEYASFGGGPLAARPNGSGLNIFNKTLYLTSNYSINGELKFYDVISFKVVCANRLFSGITQIASNLRIIDGQSVAYGAFYDCGWSGTASSTNALIDLDFNGVTTAGDLATQFVDFYNNVFNGNSQVDTGVLISKSGGNAQGSNIYCYDCESISFTGAAWQVGGNNTGRNVGRNYAGNALDIGYSGDIQGSPLYGIAVYGGGYVSFSAGANGLATMENGFNTQTGYDMYCEQTQGPCVMEHSRSESRKLIAGSNIRVVDSRTINQATTVVPGTTDPVGTYKTGNQTTGDGAYYKVTSNSSAYSGIGTPTAPLLASSGTTTTIVDTNQNIPGSVTIKLFTAADVITQAVTGSTATVRVAATSTATVTGTLTSGTCNGIETMTQATTGVTGTEVFPTPNNSGPVPLSMNNLSGTADSTHTWTGGTSGCVFTPNAAPTFSASTMLITAATGSPDSSHSWTNPGGAVFVPTGAPVNVANFGTNAFNGMLMGILSGTAINCYGVVTSNTATAITFTGGLLTKYPQTLCSAPDNTSKFVVEPNWNQGTVTDGGMTLVYQNENVIDGDAISHVFQGTLIDVIVSGGKLKPWGNGSSKTIIKNLLHSRPDWYDNSGGNNPQGCCTNDRDWDVRPILPGGSTPINWSFPATTGVPFSGALHEDLGTKPLCWSIGTVNVIAANDVCIGGRSDPGAGATLGRNILEIPAGILGRPSAFGTDQNGVDMQISGGLPTGAGTPGNIVLFFAPGGGSTGTTVQTGAPVFTFAPNGQMTSAVTTGTAPFSIGSTTNVPNLNASLLLNNTWAAPGPIGGTTPAAGTFTSVTTSGTTGNITRSETFGSTQTDTSGGCETASAPTTLATGATTTDTGLSCLPATAIIDAVVYRITTTITTAANFTIGDATIAARFCATQSTLTAGTTGVCFVQADQTGTSGPRQVSAAKVRVTTNVNPGAGAIRLIVYFHTWSGPTS